MIDLSLILRDRELIFDFLSVICGGVVIEDEVSVDKVSNLLLVRKFEPAKMFWSSKPRKLIPTKN